MKDPNTYRKDDPRSPSEHSERPDDSELFESRNQGGITFDKIHINTIYDVRDSSKRWCEAKITKIDTDDLRVYAEYLYWDSRYDEWIGSVEHNVAPLHYHTYTIGGRMKEGQRLAVKDREGNWIEAFVVDETNLQVKVHFRNAHSRYDEWLDRDSSRITAWRRARTFAQENRGLGGKKESRVWRVPGQPGASSGLSDHNKENLGIKRAFEDSAEASPLSSARHSGAATPADSARAEPTLTDDERKRKIVAGAAKYVLYESALEAQGLRVVPVRGDGNCLFRAVSHQMYGNEEYHAVVREKVMDYMEAEGEFFSQFVEGGKEMFPHYLKAKRANACWGDDPEIEAICELYRQPAEIWAFDATAGAKKLRTFHEHAVTLNASRGVTPSTSGRPGAAMEAKRTGSEFKMRLSYYGGGHYDSIVPEDVLRASGSEHKSDDSRHHHQQQQHPHHGPLHDHHHSYHPLAHSHPGYYEDRVIGKSLERSRAGTSLQQRESAAAHHSPDRSHSERHPHHEQQQQLHSPMEISHSHRNSGSHHPSQASSPSEHKGLSEDAVLSLALEASRRAALNSDYDDLETCLAMSMQDEATDHHSSGGGGSHLHSSPGKTASSSSAGAAAEADMMAIQGDLMRSIKEQSEMDYLDKAILSSLASDDHMTEEELLEIALKASQKDYQEHSHKQQQQQHHSSSSSSSSGAAPAESSTGHTFNRHQSMQLTSMSEDEALQLALRQSMDVRAAPTVQRALSDGSMARLEEEELQQALNASMRAAPHPAASSSGGGRGGGQMFVTTGGGYLEEMDEELVKAIEESLRK